MPAILSKELGAKLIGRDWSFGYNCYEVGHTWTPSCTEAALDIGATAGLKTLPLYTMLYVFSQLVAQRRYDLPTSWDTVKSIFRSSFFIFFHAYNGTLLGCALRQSLGRFYFRVLVCTPALLSSYLALAIEKPARRQALAFYMLNLASEIVYEMAVRKGYFRPIRHGETLLFSLSLAAWYYHIRKYGFGHDPVSGAVKILIGRSEAKMRLDYEVASANVDEDQGNIFSGRNSADISECSQPQSTSSKGGPDRPHRGTKWSLGDYMEGMLINCEDGLFARHSSCPHNERTCLGYVIGPMPTRFLLGYAIQSILRLAARPYDLLSDPLDALRSSFLGSSSWRRSARMGLFLMSLVSTGRLVSCSLRRYSGGNHDWHALVAGFASGLSMFWAPRSSLSMYVIWKVVEQHYLQAVKSGKLGHFQFTISSIYACSAATILYAFALEPKFLRPSYMRFLDTVSDHRLHQINRMVLDVFGTGASVGYEDYFPDLHPKYMSDQFKELIFNWMIQPYE